MVLRENKGMTAQKGVPIILTRNAGNHISIAGTGISSQVGSEKGFSCAVIFLRLIETK